MQDWIPPVAFFVIVAVITKMFLDYRMRRRLIDKGLVDENIKHLFPNESISQRLTALKWGLVLVGVGAAVLIGQLFPYRISNEITISLMFIFSGVGLLLFYLVAPKFEVNRHNQPPMNQ
jgi:hypothetical protein